MGQIRGKDSGYYSPVVLNVYFSPYFVAVVKGIVRAWLRGIADEGLLEVLLTGGHCESVVGVGA